MIDGIMVLKKAQVSIEAVFAASILLLIFTMIGVSATEKKADIAATEEILSARGECFRLSNAIEHAYTSGPGTEMNLKTGYISRIHAPDQLIYLFSEDEPDDSLWICKCAVTQISNGTSNSFSVGKGAVNVSNIKGMVIVENV